MPVIDTTRWLRDEEYPIHPVGTREKQVVLCPDPAPYDFLIPRHRYLLKFSNPRAPSQFLSEVIAYRIGVVLNVPVPPSFQAHDGNEDSPAALIEFFIGKPGDPPLELVHGGDYCERYMPGFERTKGRDHTLDLLLRIMQGEEEAGLVDDHVLYGTKVFLFDAIIGNSDRHQDNWGILWRSTGDVAGRIGSMSPAFDNGTSLGYELLEDDLPSRIAHDRLANYVARGRHHLRAVAGERHGYGHVELIEKWLRRFPQTREPMAAMLGQASREGVAQTLDQLTQAPERAGISNIRLRFVLELLNYRVNSLRGIVGL